jgi:hypothetical protein
MNKISKNLLVGAMTLTLGIGAIAGIAPAFAADLPDQDPADLNILAGAVADSELVEIEVEDVLSISTGNTGLVASIDSNGTTTALSGSYSQGPGTMSSATPGSLIQGYSNQIIKSNNPTGYFMSIMMCNSTADTNYPTVVSGCRGGNALESGVAGAPTIKMTNDNAASLTGTSGATTGGFWGFRSTVTSSNGTAATAPSGNWQAVPVFNDNTPYGEKLVEATVAGTSAVNLNYGVITNNTLPAGTYNNYVIYTAVNN